NESSDAQNETEGSDEKKGGKEIVLAAWKGDAALLGEGHLALDETAQQQRRRRHVLDSPDIHDARLLFIGSGPMATKSRRHHRGKKSGEKDAEESSEEKKE